MNAYTILAASTVLCLVVMGINTAPSQGELSLVPVAVMRDGEGGFYALDGPSDIETFTISDRIYAIVSSYRENAVQIIDITNPGTPVSVSTIRDLGNLRPTDYEGIEVFKTYDHTYVFIITENNGIFMFDITNPPKPAPLGLFTWKGESNLHPRDFNSVETFQLSSHPYALISANGHAILDVADPTQPILVSDWSEGVAFPAVGDDFRTFDVSDRTYTIIFPNSNDIQIRDITDPTKPTDVTDVLDYRDGFGSAGVKYIEAVNWLNRTYVLVFAYNVGSVNVIDVTDPSIPTPVTSINDNQAGFSYQNRLTHVETFEANGKSYAVIGRSDEIQIMNITDPTLPVWIGGAMYADEWRGHGELRDVKVIESSGRLYALVTGQNLWHSGGAGAVYVMEIVDDGFAPSLPMTITDLQVDHSKSEASVSSYGSVQVTAELTSNRFEEQAFVFLVHVRNADDTVVDLTRIATSLRFSESISLLSEFVPPDPGTYTIITSVWKSLNDQTPLAAPTSLNIVIDEE